MAPVQLAGFPYLTNIIPYNHLFVLATAAKQEAKKESAQSPVLYSLLYCKGMQVLMLNFTVTAGCPGAGLRRLPLRPALQWLPQQRGIRRSLRLNS